MVVNMDEDNTIVLRSYSNLKNIKTKIYKIGNIPILVPIELEAIGMFAILFFITVMVDSIVKLGINPIYKYILIPVGLTMLLKRAKIDGKSPHIYLLRLFQFQEMRTKTIERFEVRDTDKEIIFSE